MSRFTPRTRATERDDFEERTESWLDDVSGLCGADIPGHILCQRAKGHPGDHHQFRAEMMDIAIIRFAETAGWVGGSVALGQTSTFWSKVFWRPTGFSDNERAQLERDAVRAAEFIDHPHI